MSDDDLVVRARVDRSAFAALYDRYYPRVLRYCVRRIGVRQAAEDATSEVFLRVASHLPGFVGTTETDFRRGLFRIATNAINAQLRQARRRRELWQSAAAQGLLAANDTSIYTGVPKTEVIMTHFEINIDLPPDLFALTIPNDYQVQSFDVDASKPEERDLVESLRICATMSGGAFPEALDTMSVMKLIIGTVLKDKEGAQDKEKITQKLMNESIKIGRGFQFALALPPSAKAHYAGKGIKIDTPDRPIFWYLREIARRYRVIDATLTVHDADQGPIVEGAVPLGKTAAASHGS